MGVGGEVAVELLLFGYLRYPVEEFIKCIVAAMRAVPCQEKVDILAGILLLRCKIKSNRKSCIAVDGAMTDIPVWSNSYALLTNLLHWIEKIFLLLDLG